MLCRKAKAPWPVGISISGGTQLGWGGLLGISEGQGLGSTAVGPVGPAALSLGARVG